MYHTLKLRFSPTILRYVRFMSRAVQCVCRLWRCCALPRGL